MSESRREETRASEENAEEDFLRLDWNHHLVEIPGAHRSHRAGSEAVPSIADAQWHERRMPPGGRDHHRMYRIHRIWGHSGQLAAEPRDLGGQREWEGRPEGRDPRAFVPGSELEDGVAAAGSGPARSRAAEGLSEGAVLAPPSSPRFVPGPSQDGEEALPYPELAADPQRRPGRRCRRAAWEEPERGPSYSSYLHRGPCEWSWARPGAADCHACSGSPCHLTVRVELELWPSCSSYPDLGPWEWSWGRPGATSSYMEHCPTCPRAHRF